MTTSDNDADRSPSQRRLRRAPRLSAVDLRHRGRALALMALYEADTAGHSPEEVVWRLAEDERVPRDTVAFASALVAGVRDGRDDLDERIERAAPQFPIEQLSAVDRNIIRIALYELLRERETPIAVVMSEAVELAHVFGSDGSPRFVNGVLGGLGSVRDG
jgi:transcription antitermination protein NusB